MSNTVETPKALRVLAVITAGATWVLLLVGCLVHGTGSSLACPDWPLCFGSAFPKMENGVQFEHSHRLVATTVGLLMISLATLLHGRRQADPRGAVLGYWGVFLVCVQGALGGITVLRRLPIAVTLAHLTLSMGFFCLTVVIALRVAAPAPMKALQPEPGMTLGQEDALASLRIWVGLAVAATVAQIVLGGAVRHTASGLSCFGIPLCNGELWPSQVGAHIHMAHRFFAVALAVFVLALGVTARRRAQPDAGSALGSRPTAITVVARLSTLAMALVLVQVGLGILSVLSLLALVPVTLHLGVAALLLACNLALFYYLPAPLKKQAPAEMGEAARAW